MQTSTRKPHKHLAGYRAELKSKHPGLPGHIVIFDRQNGGDWIDAGERWVVMHINGDNCGCMVAVGSIVCDADICAKYRRNGRQRIDGVRQLDQVEIRVDFEEAK